MGEAYNAGNVIEDNDYVITNISKDGRIVPFYNKLDLKDTVDLDYVIELLRLYPIACPQNIETHIYRFYPDAEPDFGTVEYSSFSNNQCNVFIPGYPMLMSDTWDGYKVGLLPTLYEAEDPDNWGFFEEETGFKVEPLDKGILDTKDYYTTPGVNYAGIKYNDNEVLYHIFPEAWDKYYSYTLNTFNNYLYYMASDEEKELALFRHFKYGEELPDSSDNFGLDPKYVVIALCGAIVLFGIIYYCIKRANRS